MLKPVIAAALVFVGAAQAAPPENFISELKACRIKADDKQRLTCFDHTTAQLEDGLAVAPVPPTRSVADFGGESLRPAERRPVEAEFMTAKVTKISFNAVKHFTVALDNGQVWRQVDADTRLANFRDESVVKITRGFMDSYSLSVEGVWGFYKVKRIK